MPHLPRQPCFNFSSLEKLPTLLENFPCLPAGRIHKLAGFPVAVRQLPVASTNHCISRSPVLTSGPAIYFLGIKGLIILAKLWIYCFFNSSEPPDQTIPALAPPKGISAKAF